MKRGLPQEPLYLIRNVGTAGALPGNAGLFTGDGHNFLRRQHRSPYRLLLEC